MEHILIVEDDRELNQGLTYTLTKSGYFVLSAYSLKEAKEQIEQGAVELILLDVNLPDGEGFALCEWMQETYQTQERHRIPVLFLSARDLEEDVLKGYEAGALDYITKPFSMKILQKKIEIALQKTRTSRKHKYEDEFLSVDFDAFRTKIAGKECALTPTEYRLLRLFIENRAQLLTYSVMLDKLWDCNGAFIDKHALAVNVNRLRKKIEDEEHQYISNVYGMGYQWLR
ncbi:response regulator transcription factor [Hespellia stercorisuis]|uniref:Stage 0 sporulation protein A homolog n=1 Tax=Hespellia stercorisuis DSM 15480 TaxID=1121950 RepID=A0A1M6UIY9_9FIRM|nr:response regulator transcription factor [Hespellia stercorisuis]SHK69139.1 DNA-binding response regulator, OmpR family, contains REC and winged-helix (wHTH) domain [Hespellia stercorisuis DSM 15480]